MTFIAPYALELHAQHKARQTRYRAVAIELERRQVDQAAWRRLLEYRAAEKEEESQAKAELDRMAAKALAAGIIEAFQDIIAPARMAARSFALGIARAYLLPRPAGVKISDIIKAVAIRFGTTRLEIISHKRPAKIMLPRHVAMAVARRATTRTLNEIARHFGDRDHTTILHGINKIEAKIAAGDVELGKLVDSLVAEVTMAARGKGTL